MTANGEFISPQPTPFATRILFWAVVVAVIAGGVSLAAFALWLALAILPIALGAALIAYALFRYKMWQASKAQGRRGQVWRP